MDRSDDNTLSVSDARELATELLACVADNLPGDARRGVEVIDVLRRGQ